MVDDIFESEFTLFSIETDRDARYALHHLQGVSEEQRRPSFNKDWRALVHANRRHWSGEMYGRM